MQGLQLCVQEHQLPPDGAQRLCDDRATVTTDRKRAPCQPQTTPPRTALVRGVEAENPENPELGWRSLLPGAGRARRVTHVHAGEVGEQRVVRDLHV